MGHLWASTTYIRSKSIRILRDIRGESHDRTAHELLKTSRRWLKRLNLLSMMVPWMRAMKGFWRLSESTFTTCLSTLIIHSLSSSWTTLASIKLQLKRTIRSTCSRYKASFLRPSESAPKLNTSAHSRKPTMLWRGSTSWLASQAPSPRCLRYLSRLMCGT